MDLKKNPSNQNHLAWHETMEIHELVAFQSIGLMKLKKAYPEITDSNLKRIYEQAINSVSNNIRELVQFYPFAPKPVRESEERIENSPFYSGNLLGFAKTAVRNYSIAITETATPSLRSVLRKQLLGAIDTHATIYNYMYERGYYPSYDLERLLQNDLKLANQALGESL